MREKRAGEHLATMLSIGMIESAPDLEKMIVRALSDDHLEEPDRAALSTLHASLSLHEQKRGSMSIKDYYLPLIPFDPRPFRLF